MTTAARQPVQGIRSLKPPNRSLSMEPDGRNGRRGCRCRRVFSPSTNSGGEAPDLPGHAPGASARGIVCCGTTLERLTRRRQSLRMNVELLQRGRYVGSVGCNCLTNPFCETDSRPQHPTHQPQLSPNILETYLRQGGMLLGQAEISRPVHSLGFAARVIQYPQRPAKSPANLVRLG